MAHLRQGDWLTVETQTNECTTQNRAKLYDLGPNSAAPKNHLNSSFEASLNEAPVWSTMQRYKPAHEVLELDDTGKPTSVCDM